MLLWTVVGDGYEKIGADMPRYRDGFPRSRKECRHGVWRIAWRWGDKKYSVSTAIADKVNIHEIEILLRDLAHQLASNDRPVLSDLWSSSPGVMRYVADRFGDGDALGSMSAQMGGGVRARNCG